MNFAIKDFIEDWFNPVPVTGWWTFPKQLLHRLMTYKQPIVNIFLTIHPRGRLLLHWNIEKIQEYKWDQNHSFKIQIQIQNWNLKLKCQKNKTLFERDWNIHKYEDKLLRLTEQNSEEESRRRRAYLDFLIREKRQREVQERGEARIALVK